MTDAALKRANEIQNRLGALDKAIGWLDDVERKNVSLIATGCSMADIVELSPEERTIMKAMCCGEMEKLKTELENL